MDSRPEVKTGSILPAESSFGGKGAFCLDGGKNVSREAVFQARKQSIPASYNILGFLLAKDRIGTKCMKEEIADNFIQRQNKEKKGRSALENRDF